MTIRKLFYERMLNTMRRASKKNVSGSRALRVLCMTLCAVMLFGLVSPVGAVSAYADEPAACTGAADCTAEVHEEGCLSQADTEEAAVQDDEPAAVCSKSEDCTAEVHEEGCPKYTAPENNDEASVNAVWSDGTLTGSIDGAAVSVAGQMPAGAQLKITKAEGGTSDADGSFSHTYTLAIVTLEGETEVPADTAGKSYSITVTAPDGKEFETFAVKAGGTDVTVTNSNSSVSFTLTGLGELAVSGKLVSTAKSVAKIVSTGVEYTTLDEAVAAAADGDTILLLANCETAGLNLSKNLTIDGDADSKYTVSFNDKGIALWGKALSFNNCNVVMTGVGSTPYTAEWNKMAICASPGASLTLNNTTMSIVGANIKGIHAIYFCSNNKLNLNGSALTIRNYFEDALEWDGGDGGYNINLVNSTFISDHNRSGFTGTFVAKIDNSKVDVINSTGNGSNGSHFEIVNGSVVNFNDNGSHGLSAGNLTIDNSTVTASRNGANGIHVAGTLNIQNNSNVTIQGQQVHYQQQMDDPRRAVHRR